MSERELLGGLLALAEQMGRVIRELDENEDHSALWTQDGGYVADPRFQAVLDFLHPPAAHGVMGTFNDQGEKA